MNDNLHKVVRQILNDIAHPWTVEEMAAIAEVSVGYFHTLFRKETGMTPTAYLKFTRIETAAEQLNNPDCLLPVKGLAHLVGCKDVSHFTKDFKAQFGLTPTKFRKKAMEKFQKEYGSARNLRFGQEKGDLAKE